jgi:hypothetical protein
VKLFLCFCFFGFFFNACFAESSAYDNAVSSVKGVVCQKRLRQVSEFRLLFDSKEFVEWYSSKVDERHFNFSGWSQDLIVKCVRDVEKRFSGDCRLPSRIAEALSLLKRSFLREVGALSIADENDIDALFRGLISTNKDADDIKAKLEGLKKVPKEKIFEAVYGVSPRLVRGVLVLAPRSDIVDKISAFVSEICGAGEECRFWDPRFLFRVMVTQDKVAAFIPQYSVLLLSAKLFDEVSILHKIIVFHELVHEAEENSIFVDGTDLKKEFDVFSGWRKDASGHLTALVHKTDKIRKDKLTELSQSDPAFSILPDLVYEGMKGYDGFAMGKSFEESVKRQDTSEDLADHVALFRFFPMRFCLNAKEIAPRKFHWIEKKFFNKSKPAENPCLHSQ